MTDGYDEAAASVIMERILEKFWDAKDIFELQDDFDLLFKFYENMKYYQNQRYRLNLNIPKPKHLISND